DGVFDEGLQEEGRYGRIQCRPIDTSLDHKLVMKPQGLHFEVGIDNVHLLPECNEWPFMLVEGGPQEHAQSGGRFGYCGRVDGRSQKPVNGRMARRTLRSCIMPPTQPAATIEIPTDTGR